MEGGSNGTPELSASYAAAFSAYLADRGERELGAAYDLGRQAVAGHLSVLDLAEAHHAALRAALVDGARPPEVTLQAIDHLPLLDMPRRRHVSETIDVDPKYQKYNWND